MIDLKVVAAVLVTLLGIAVGMGQGTIQQGDFTGLKDLPNIVNKIRDFDWGRGTDFFAQENGKEKIAINASLRRDQLQEIKLSFSRPVRSLTATYSSSGGDIKIGGMEISPKGSEGTLKITDYRGSIKLGDRVSLDGKASAADLNGVSFNSSTITVSTTGFEPSHLQLRRLPLTTFNFKQVTGELHAGSRNTSISLEDRDLDITGFSGDLTVDAEQGSYQLAGNASQVMTVSGQPEIVLK